MDADTIIGAFVWFWVILIGGAAIFAIGSILVAIVCAVLSVLLPVVIIAGVLMIASALVGNM